MYLKQSTASQSVLLGPFVDDTDGATAETGLTIANTDIRLSKNGGNMAAKNSGGGTHDENGWYTITLDATDTNTVGRLQVSCKVAGALAVWMEFQVLEEDIYDALIGASAAGFDSNQRVDVGEWLGTAVTSGTGGPDVNVNAISDDTTAATNAEAFFDGTGYAGTGNTIPTVTSVTNQVTANTTQIEGVDATDQINAACDASIETYGLDHLISAAVVGTDVADNSIVAQLVSASATADWDDYDNTNESLGHLASDTDTIITSVSNIDSLFVGATSAVNDPGAAATTTVFNTDLNEVDDFWNDATIVFTSGALQGQSRVIADFANTNGTITLDEALTSAPADNVTFQIRIDHTHTKTQIAQAILSEDASSFTTNSTLGAIVNDWEDGGRLDVILDARMAEASINTTGGAVDTVTSVTNGVTVSTISDGAIGADAVADIFSTTTIAEAYAADGAAGTPAQLLYLIQQHLTEFAVGGTTWTTKKLDGSTTAATFTLDDGTSPTSLTRAT